MDTGNKGLYACSICTIFCFQWKYCGFCATDYVIICLCKVFSIGHGYKMAPHLLDAKFRKANLSYVQKTCYLFQSLIISYMLKTFVLKCVQSFFLLEWATKFHTKLYPLVSKLGNSTVGWYYSELGACPCFLHTPNLMGDPTLLSLSFPSLCVSPFSPHFF